MAEKYPLQTNAITIIGLIGLFFSLAFYFGTITKELINTLEYLKDKAEIKEIIENQKYIIEMVEGSAEDSKEIKIDTGRNYRKLLELSKNTKCE